MWIYDYKSEEDNPYTMPPFVRITHMCYVDNLPLWTYPWHMHPDSYELGYIIEGSGFLTVESQNLPVKKGSITLVPPNTMHRFSSPEENGMRYYSIRIAAEPADGELQSFLKGLGIAVTTGLSHLDYVKSTFDLLFDMHQVSGGIVTGNFQTVTLGLFALTRAYFSSESQSVLLDEHHSAVDILRYIEANSSKKITLESLAKEFNVSPSHLSRIFTNAYHMSPIHYLIYSRVTYATEYLLKTDLSVAEIAERVGYDNPTHFTNLFVKRIGCTPSEFRANNMKKPGHTTGQDH